MMHLTSPPILEAFAWALLHFIWQGALLAGILAWLYLLLPKNSGLRYNLALVTLLAMMSCLIITTSVLHEPKTNTTSLPIEQPGTGLSLVNPVNLTPAITSTASQPVDVQDTPGNLQQVLPWVLLLWFIGLVIFSMRLFTQWRYAKRFKNRHQQQATEPWQNLLAKLQQRLNIKRTVTLLESSLVDSPVMIGVIKPVILLPVAALNNLTQEQVEAILLHELAHIKRNDYLVNLIQTIIETILFYHPAVWWVGKQIRFEREHCCDDMVVKHTTNAVTYAKALTSLEGIRDQPDLALAASDGSLLRRVRRLVGTPKSPYQSGRWLAGIATFTLLLSLGLPVSPQVATSFALAQAAKIDWSLLTLEPREAVADVDNAYLQMVELAKDYGAFIEVLQVENINDYFALEVSENALQSFLDKHTEFFERYHAIAKMEHASFPESFYDWRAYNYLDGFEGWWLYRLAILYHAQAAQHHHKGQVNQALNAALDSIRIANMLLDTRGTAYETDIASRILVDALKHLRTFIKTPPAEQLLSLVEEKAGGSNIDARLARTILEQSLAQPDSLVAIATPTQIQGYLQTLESTPDLMSVTLDNHRVELQRGFSAIDTFSSGSDQEFHELWLALDEPFTMAPPFDRLVGEGNLLFRRNPLFTLSSLSKVRYAEHMTKSIQSANNCDAFSKENFDDEFNSATNTLRWYDVLWNAQGKMLADSLTNQDAPYYMARYTCPTMVELAATQLVLALTAYERATNKLPETLESLVPEYLSALPTHPFTGKEIIYNADERWLIFEGGEPTGNPSRPYLEFEGWEERFQF